MLCRRSSERYPLDAIARVSPGQGTVHVFRTRDISAQGLFLYTRTVASYDFCVGTTLHVELLQGPSRLVLKTHVARIVVADSHEAAAYPCGFGLRIEAVIEAHPDGLNGWLAHPGAR